MTRVHFRKWPDDGEVIALFPDLSEGYALISSYMHIGQHGSAHRRLITGLPAATPDEYAALKAELEGAPYRYTFEVLP